MLRNQNGLMCTVFAALVIAACSSSSSSPNGNGGGGGGSCSCSITFNGTPGTLNCGQTGCVGKEQFACASDGSSSIDRGPCPAGGLDAGGGGGGGVDSGGGGMQCLAKGKSCGTPDNCCSGTFCGSGSRCSVNYGGACTVPSDCEPASLPVSPGGDCQKSVCCELKGYPCQTPGPDLACCSGTCGAPNGSGISFCK